MGITGEERRRDLLQLKSGKQWQRVGRKEAIDGV